MRTFKNLSLGLAVAVALFGLATTSSADMDFSKATGNGAVYKWWGNTGELTVVGQDGAPFAAYDINGNMVGHGAIDGGAVSFLAGNSGVGPDGTIIYVIVDSEIVAATDPDYDWR